MSKEAMKWYSEQRVADATLSNLLYVLAYEAKKGTGDCTSSQAVLALKTGLTDRAVRANLVILSRLEIIVRHERNKGRYGRTTDLISLALERTFDVSKASVKALRKTLKKRFPPEHSSSGAESSHRNLVPLPPEPRSGEYNQVYQEDSLSVGIDGTCSVVREGTEVGTTGEVSSPDRDHVLDDKVVMFRPRGAL